MAIRTNDFDTGGVDSDVARASSALFTDHYELTALAAALRDGTAARRAAFEVFTRRLPNGRRYGVVAGVDRIVDAVMRFRFESTDITWLVSAGVVDDDTARWLDSYRFSGDITAYREGELYFPHSPIVTVTGTFADCLVLETVILSILNHDCAIAGAAARMVVAANGRGLIEMGGRRTHEAAAVDSARVAYLCGFDATSNLAAGRRYGIPTVGTAMHAFTLAHDDELGAFSSQIQAQGVATTLLVDTFDIDDGITSAVKAAQRFGATGPGAVRVDSGDPMETVPKARRQLDSLGASDTGIVVTGNLDEHVIAALGATPATAYGVGTALVTGSGHPAADLVYKLVAIETAGGEMRPVAKRSSGKTSVGGRKWAYRAIGADGRAVGETFLICDDDGAGSLSAGPGIRALCHPVVVEGEPVELPSLDAARSHHRSVMAELRPIDRRLDAGEPAFDAIHHEPG